MTIGMDITKSRKSEPIADPSTDQNPVNINSSLAAVQTLLASSQQMLLNATATLVEGMKPKEDKHSATTGIQAAMKAAPAGDGTPTQTELISQAYSDIAQIDNLYQAVDAGTLTWTELVLYLYQPGLIGAKGPYYNKSVGPYNDLIAIVSKITDPDVKSLINQVTAEIHLDPSSPYPPQAADWRKWWNNNKEITSAMSAWLSNTATNDALDKEEQSPQDKMNLLQIIIDLSQKNNIEVNDKGLDTLFFGLNSDISETVAAFFMQQDGNWADAQKDITTFLMIIPPAPKDPTTLPNYSSFVGQLTKLTDPSQKTWPYSFVTSDVLLSDGFAFTDAWLQFRTATPIVDPNHITYGGG